MWTGTSRIPEKPEKPIGLGVTLPLYASGPPSVGWWAMFITMLGIMSAFLSLVFGYFFYWTSRASFLDHVTGPGVLWPSIALALTLAAWVCTVAGKRVNARDNGAAFSGVMLLSALLSLGSAAALVEGPIATGMDPTVHVYPAIVWALVTWAVVHLLVGALMQLYCLARRLARKLTAAHDIDIVNVPLYWHFTGATVLITVAVIAGFPEVAP